MEECENLLLLREIREMINQLVNKLTGTDEMFITTVHAMLVQICGANETNGTVRTTKWRRWCGRRSRSSTDGRLNNVDVGRIPDVETTPNGVSWRIVFGWRVLFMMEMTPWWARMCRTEFGISTSFACWMARLGVKRASSSDGTETYPETKFSWNGRITIESDANMTKDFRWWGIGNKRVEATPEWTKRRLLEKQSVAWFWWIQSRFRIMGQTRSRVTWTSAVVWKWPMATFSLTSPTRERKPQLAVCTSFNG